MMPLNEEKMPVLSPRVSLSRWLLTFCIGLELECIIGQSSLHEGGSVEEASVS